jgi:hypothetical protein
MHMPICNILVAHAPCCHIVLLLHYCVVVTLHCCTIALSCSLLFVSPSPSLHCHLALPFMVLLHLMLPPPMLHLLPPLQSTSARLSPATTSLSCMAVVPPPPLLACGSLSQTTHNAVAACPGHANACYPGHGAIHSCICSAPLSSPCPHPCTLALALSPGCPSPLPHQGHYTCPGGWSPHCW